MGFTSGRSAGAVAQTRLDLGLLPLELGHARLHRGLVHAVLDGCHDALDGPLDLGERLAIGIDLGASRVVLAVHLLVVGAHGLGDRLRRHQSLRQAGEHPLLDHGAADRTAVAACAPPMVIEAAVPIIHDDPVLALAAAAGEQTREQKDRAAGHVEPFGPGFAHADGGRLEQLCQFGLPGLYSLPQRVIDDAKLRHRGPDPFRFGIAA